MRGEVMDKITAVGLDLAKQIIQVYGIDVTGRVVPRNAASGAVAGAADPIVALRGGDGRCSGAHHWARAQAARPRAPNHGRGARTAVSQESGCEGRRQRFRGDLYRGGATE